MTARNALHNMRRMVLCHTAHVDISRQGPTIFDENAVWFSRPQ
jgi:hypothetical protein